MSRALEATVSGGVVKVGGLTITGAVIFSQGAADSSGILFLQDDKAYYFPNATDDLDSTLEQVITALGKAVDSINKIGTTLTAIGAGMTGPTTAPPPTLATDVASLVTYAAAITTAKTELETLKGALK